jgi:diguanylate cyclase (GGDEF)-like protein/PAS domain S-box-containing protein
MRRTTKNSLHLRLWPVIALAVIPMLVMMLADHWVRRQHAITALEREVDRLLVAARQEEELAQQSVEAVLRIMANADDMAALDPLECSNLAGRLIKSLTGFNNIGAVRPDGTVFCSALPPRGPLNLSGRAWFEDALAGDGITPGVHTIGLISGRPSLVFGYPLRDGGGTVQAVLFASLGLRWFDRLVAGYQLAEGWEASLITTAGRVLARHPAAGRVDNEVVSRAMLDDILATMGGARPIAESDDHDRRRRLYGVAPLQIAKEGVLVAIAAPLGHSLSDVDRAFWLRIGLLTGLALLSALLTRLYVHRLIEQWALKLRGAVGRIAAGRFDTRVDRFSPVEELRAVEDGINRMAAELEARDAVASRLSAAVEQSPEAIVITDTAGRIEYVNDAFVRSSGYAREELIGHNPRLLNAGITPPATYEALWSTLLRGEVWRGEFHNTRKDGSTYVELATIAPIKRPDGAITHYVGVKEDITERRHSQQLLHRLAYYDPLTNLPNRAMLRERLRQSILASARSGEHGMLLLVDIDRFKQVNDTAGQDAGDKLLQVTSRRLRHAVREENTVARQGDDDFAVIIENLGADEADAIARAELIAKKIHAELNAPYELDHQRPPHYATHSIGITLFQGRKWNAETLLKQAEVALHTAKDDGRNALRFFNPRMQAAADARAKLEAGLRDAIANKGFHLYYQPQSDRDGRIVGAEALVRWFGADGRMISPAEFIPLAEHTGLIVPIGRWVLATACAQLAAWQRDAATRHLTIAVNVSARQFHQPDFVDQVGDGIARHAIDPAGLKLELTESVFLGDLDETILRMQQIRALGVRFALDDFGTGYSSLSYLKRLPFDQLKIDQSFVRDMLSDNSSETIVRAILGMSTSLGLEVVAEGVETPAQRHFLQTQGCQRFQGYLFGRPQPIENWQDLALQAQAPAEARRVG